ncbi:MAG: hypothetical protein HYZ28_23675 [Myxococcales bacterium]|nr:hypothetical protein [Myxococcales bacterium]
MFGFLALVVAVSLGVFGLLQHLKGKRILAAPFRKTGELAKNGASAADPKGMVSTEGEVVAPKPLLSPCSQTPCLYYEVKITRNWEKQERTENGYKTRTGSDTVNTLKQGMQFQLNDGSGPVEVDLSQGADAELKRGFDKSVTIGSFIPGQLEFGSLRMQTPVLSSDDRTTAFKAEERIVPVGGKLFALGKLEGAVIRKPNWRSMLLSNKGRQGLLASTATKKKVGFISSGAAAVLSIPLFIFGPKGSPGVPSCQSQMVGLSASASGSACQDRFYGTEGDSYSWKVDQPGAYTVKVVPPKVQIPIEPSIEIRKGGSLVAASDYPDFGQPVALTAKLEAGEYKLVVRDYLQRKMEGGFGYGMELSKGERQPAAEPDSPVAAEEALDEQAVPAKKAVAKAEPKAKSAKAKATSKTKAISKKTQPSSKKVASSSKSVSPRNAKPLPEPTGNTARSSARGVE